jgi:hypothetical protein
MPLCNYISECDFNSVRTMNNSLNIIFVRSGHSLDFFLNPFLLAGELAEPVKTKKDLGSGATPH